MDVDRLGIGAAILLVAGLVYGYLTQGLEGALFGVVGVWLAILFGKTWYDMFVRGK